MNAVTTKTVEQLMEDLRVAQEAAANQSFLKRLGNVVGLESAERANMDAAQKRVDNLNTLIAEARVDNMIASMKEEAARIGQVASKIGAAADADAASPASLPKAPSWDGS